jgi:choloylglycine hydrolase
MKIIASSLCSLILFAAGLLSLSPRANACSRVLYVGLDSTLVVGRSLDWKTPIPTNLYVYPRGLSKQGSNRPNAIKWLSRYGSVYAVSYDAGITEGMNEAGLVVNGLFCKNAVYNSNNLSLPQISLAMFVAWLLDCNATTQQAIDMLRQNPFALYGATFDSGTTSALHWGITDATGNSAIIEFHNGTLQIYPMDNYRAMTNDPEWPAMTAIINYWNGIGGENMLPGTVSSPSRCVRANFFAHNVKAVADADSAVAITRSIVENVSVPYLYAISGEPNLSSTQWRSYADMNRRRYYFEFVTSPSLFYVDLTALNLAPGAPILKLNTASNPNLGGNVNGLMVKNQPFIPQFGDNVPTAQ